MSLLAMKSLILESALMGALAVYRNNLTGYKCTVLKEES